MFVRLEPDLRFRIGRCAFAGAPGLPALLVGLADCASRLCGDEAWAGPAGRAAPDLFAAIEPAAAHGPRQGAPASQPAMRPTAKITVNMPAGSPSAS